MNASQMSEQPMVLTHEQAHELIQKRMQTRLDAFERRALDAHLADCGGCTDYQVEMTALDRRLAESLSERWPERRYTAAELDRKLAGMQTRVRRVTMFKAFSSIARLGAAAALLIVIIAGLGWVSQGFLTQRTSGGSLLPDQTPAALCDYPNYQVQAGDTLLGIANAFDVSIEEIKNQNRMPGDGIVSGQVLEIPVCAQMEQPAAVEQPEGVPPDLVDCAEITYTVQVGDILEGIAQTFGVSEEQIRAVNGIKGNEHYVGQALRIYQCPAKEQGTFQALAYSVKAGDTCETIAISQHVKVDTIRVVNGLGAGCALSEGQTLYIPRVVEKMPEAQYNAVLYIFWSVDCPTCTAARTWLESLRVQYPALEVISFDIEDAGSREMYTNMLEAYSVPDLIKAPIFFMGNHHWSGFTEDLGQRIEAAVETCLANLCEDAGAGVIHMRPVRLPAAEAEKLVRKWVFANNPDTNPNSTFPLEEITTVEVWQRLEAQVFKVSSGDQMFQAYLVKNGFVTPIGESFGGMGISDLFVTDLDANGAPELLYGFSFGSGMHQSAVGLAYETPEGPFVTMEAMDQRYMGDLALEKVDDQRVRVYGVQPGQSERENLGMARFVDGRLMILAEGSEMKTYENPDTGISFLYPVDWQPAEGAAGGERYQGGNGFFELLRLEGTDDLKRACEWEANRDGSYGERPGVTITIVDDREVCLILSSLSGPQAHAAVVFTTLQGEIAALWLDPVHLQAISASLRFSWKPDEVTPEPVGAVDGPADVKLETRQFGPLTLEEYAVVSADVDTPGHFEFNERIPAEVKAKRATLRETNLEWSLEETNRRLEPFGYRLVLKTEAKSDLYRGSELVKGDLNMVFPVSVYRNEQGGGDFALLVEDSTYQKWLVRKDSLKPWDETAHRFTHPVMSGPNLLTAERDLADSSNADRVLVWQEGEPIFAYTLAPSSVIEPVKGLWGWDGGWALEVNGTLFVNGANWNRKDVFAEEIFNFSLLDGKPFFFFQRGGKVNAWYNGQEIPLEYDEVIHYRCCEPGAFNPGSNTIMVWFYALKDGLWYYVELGGFQ